MVLLLVTGAAAADTVNLPHSSLKDALESITLAFLRFTLLMIEVCWLVKLLPQICPVTAAGKTLLIKRLTPITLFGRR